MTTVYDELLTELEDLAKAMPEATDADDEHKEPDADDEGGPSDGDEDNEGEKPMAKSLTVTLEDGSEAEAVDAESLVKSFQDRLDAVTEGSGKVLGKQAELIKSLVGTVDSLKAEVAALRNQGRGRKTVVTMAGGAEEAPMAKSVAPADVLAKCLDAQKAGKLSGLDVSMAEGYINRGLPIPDRIIAQL